SEVLPNLGPGIMSVRMVGYTEKKVCMYSGGAGSGEPHEFVNHARRRRRRTSDRSVSSYGESPLSAADGAGNDSPSVFAHRPTPAAVRALPCASVAPSDSE